MSGRWGSSRPNQRAFRSSGARTGVVEIGWEVVEPVEDGAFVGDAEVERRDGVEVDEDGTIVNAAGSYIDDCLYATPWVWYWTTLPVDPVTGERLPPPQDPWPPPDWNMSNPDWLISPPDIARWNDYLDSLNALNVQLLTVTGLDPGELIQFRPSSTPWT